MSLVNSVLSGKITEAKIKEAAEAAVKEAEKKAKDASIFGRLLG